MADATATATTKSTPDRLGQTDRQDAWWVGPSATALGLGAFVVYVTFRVFYNAGYVIDSPESAYILSPFYSPLILWEGMPSWLSPAMFILWVPAGFRLTCYYYRKAYYRAFMADPPGCAVGEGRKHYHGETRLFIFQNIHRYFMYLAVALVVILSIDVVHACIWPAREGTGNTFGISVGTLVLLVNTTLLGFYTFSCHSVRHLIGGRVDCFTCVAFGKARYQAWRGISAINAHHMFWAWTSLFMVAFADLYVWMVEADVIKDLRIL